MVDKSFFKSAQLLVLFSIIGLTNADGSLNDPVVLQATPVAGFAPLTVAFQITSNSAPETIQIKGSNHNLKGS